jgi:hypothetical protein
MFEEDESVVVETPVVAPVEAPVEAPAVVGVSNPTLNEIRIKNIVLKLGQATTMDQVQALVEELKCLI